MPSSNSKSTVLLTAHLLSSNLRATIIVLLVDIPTRLKIRSQVHLGHRNTCGRAKLNDDRHLQRPIRHVRLSKPEVEAMAKSSGYKNHRSHSNILSCFL